MVEINQEIVRLKIVVRFLTGVIELSGFAFFFAKQHFGFLIGDILLQ